MFVLWLKFYIFTKPFFDRGLEAEIERAKPHPQILGQRTLTDLGRMVQTTQNFELDFLLETSQFL